MTSELIAISEQENVPALANALDGLWASLERSAAFNITQAAGDSLSEYSQIEQRAMLLAEMLNQSKGLDLASVMLKGRILQEIEQDSLFSVHPGQYHTLEDLAKDQGIGISELSQIRDLYNIIFPWVRETLGMDIRVMWENIGKSNMRELVPILKRIITGEEARGTVEQTFEYIMNDVAATMRSASGLEEGAVIDEDELSRAAVAQLLQDGIQLTNSNLRQRLRPDRTPSIEAHLLHMNGNHYVLACLDDRQEQMLARRLHGYWDPITLSGIGRQELVALLRQYPGLASFFRMATGQDPDQLEFGL